jgi:hypothetical protein
MMEDEFSASSFFVYDKKSGVFMKLFILIFLALLTSCSVQQTKVYSPTPIPLISVLEDQIPEPPIEEKKIQSPQTKESVEKKLEYYLYGREIKPSVIVNNTEYDQTEVIWKTSKSNGVAMRKKSK